MTLQTSAMQTSQHGNSFARACGMVLALTLSVLMIDGCAPHKPLTDASKASSTDPLKGIDLYAAGAQAYRRGDKETALRELQAAVAQNPNLRMAQAMLGDLFRSKGDYQNAAVHYEKAAELDPYSIANHYNLGVMYQLLNKLKDAAAAYLKALDLDPRDVKSNMNLGTVYLALGQTDDAINYLERATMLDQNSGEAWSNLGVAYDARGRGQLAEKAYRKALELDSSPIIMQNLGSNLITQGRATESIAVMRQVVERSNTAAAHKRYADALVLGKKQEEALREYDTALRLDSKYYPAMNDKGFLLIKQYHAQLDLDENKVKEATALWKVSLRINAKQPRIEAALKEFEKPALFGK